MRGLWFVTGCFAVALGTLGIVLPLLPTVAFMILAAFCFARSSPRLHRWLIDHPVYGPAIRDWQDSGAISLKAKRLATLAIGLAFGLSLAVGLAQPILVLQAFILLILLSFIWSRPHG